MAAKRFSFLSVLVLYLVCSTCTAKDALYSGERLSTGQILVNGVYILNMQFNCNLVLYAIVALWSSGTAGKGVNCYATLFNNGTFVVNSGNGTRLWSNNVAGPNGDYILSLQPDRNLAIYGTRIWATNTQVPPLKKHHP